MGKHKRNKKKKKRNSRKNEQSEASGPNAKGKKRELSPCNNNGQPRGTGNDSNLYAQQGEINTSRSDGTCSTSHEEGGLKRQKRGNENEQSTERTIGKTFNTGASQLGNFSGSNQVRLNASGSSKTFVREKSLLAAGQYQVLQFLLYSSTHAWVMTLSNFLYVLQKMFSRRYSKIFPRHSNNKMFTS